MEEAWITRMDATLRPAQQERPRRRGAWQWPARSQKLADPGAP